MWLAPELWINGQKRDIIVQIEIWATHDFSNAENRWPSHPFNPANNINYTAGESGLPAQFTLSDPSTNPSFHTVPELNNNTLVLRYQQAFVDKLLSHSLDYPHVLYCMNNETKASHEWGDYWANYVREGAQAKGVEVHLTDMRWDITIQESDNIHIYDRPDRYAFLDISQVSANADDQWRFDRILSVRERIAKQPRPMNQTKIYTMHETDGSVAVKKMCVSLFAGCAGMRFHRPLPRNWMNQNIKDGDYEASGWWGLGLSPLAQTTICSLRMLTDELNIFVCEPSNHLLSDRSSNEAYCLAERGRQYAVYFPDGGAVKLDVSAASGSLRVRWLDIGNTTWQQPQTVSGSGTLELRTRGKGHWAVLVAPAS